MGLTMGERRAFTEEVAGRYRRAGRKEKGVILAEFVESTGYSRNKYAIHLLNSWGRTRLGAHRWSDGQARRRTAPTPQAPRATAPLRPGGAEGPQTGNNIVD